MDAAAVGAALEGMGIRLRPEWLGTCLSQLPPPPPGARPQQEQWVLAQVYERFLHSDLNASGLGGAFPPAGLGGVREHTIQDTHVLQVDAVKNISVPAEHRDKAATPGAGRCLLLALSDGAQRAVGMEYAPIPDLRVDLPPGVKVAIHRCRVNEGVLLLTKEVVQVLGGNNGQPPPPPSQQAPSQQSPGARGGAGGGAPPPPQQQRQQRQQHAQGQGVFVDNDDGGGGGGWEEVGSGSSGGQLQHHQQQERRQQAQQSRQRAAAPPRAPAGGASAAGAGGAATTLDPYDDPGIDWDAIPDYTTGGGGGGGSSNSTAAAAAAAAASAQPNLQPVLAAHEEDEPLGTQEREREREREVAEALQAAAAAMEEEDDNWAYAAEAEVMAEAEAEAEAAAAAAAAAAGDGGGGGAFRSKKRPRVSSPLTTAATLASPAAISAGRGSVGGGGGGGGTARSTPTKGGAPSVILVPSQSQCSTQASGPALSASSAAAPGAALSLPLPPLRSLRDEASEGPFVRLADVGRFPGQTVRVKGVVVRVLKAQVGKKTPLRVTVEVDDGSGALLPAQLGAAMLEGVLGMTPTAFRALLDRDRAAANQVMAGIAPAVYKLEGVLTVRLSQDGGSSGAQQKQKATATLLACEDPTWDDVRGLINVCGVRLGLSDAAPSSEGSDGGEGKQQEVIILSG